MLYRLRQRAGPEEGFTLIELLVVILIIGILAAVAIPAFLSQRTKAHDANAKTDAQTAQTAAEAEGLDNNGNYTSVVPGTLIAQEATLVSANRLQAVGNANGYTVAVTSNATGGSNPVEFAITRTTTGNTVRTCGAASTFPTLASATANTAPSPTAITQGGCDAGTW
jgi:type IV pilus assembly protein PilA